MSYASKNSVVNSWKTCNCRGITPQPPTTSFPIRPSIHTLGSPRCCQGNCTAFLPFEGENASTEEAYNEVTFTTPKDLSGGGLRFEDMRRHFAEVPDLPVKKTQTS
jgi:hypothetical protein